MAHELGHLPQGKNAHSPAGLMRARWRDQDLTLAQPRMSFLPKGQADTCAGRSENQRGRDARERFSRAITCTFMRVLALGTGDGMNRPRPISSPSRGSRGTDRARVAWRQVQTEIRKLTENRRRS